jgi:hypothetical protein
MINIIGKTVLYKEWNERKEGLNKWEWTGSGICLGLFQDSDESCQTFYPVFVIAKMQGQEIINVYTESVKFIEPLT